MNFELWCAEDPAQPYIPSIEFQFRTVDEVIDQCPWHLSLHLDTLLKRMAWLRHICPICLRGEFGTAVLLRRRIRRRNIETLWRPIYKQSRTIFQLIVAACPDCLVRYHLSDHLRQLKGRQALRHVLKQAQTPLREVRYPTSLYREIASYL